jgi:hypothetical protein
MSHVRMGHVLWSDQRHESATKLSHDCPVQGNAPLPSSPSYGHVLSSDQGSESVTGVRQK